VVFTDATLPGETGTASPTGSTEVAADAEESQS
jgi:hypothetical protein